MCGLGRLLVWDCYWWMQGFVPDLKCVCFCFSVVTRGRVSVSEEGSWVRWRLLGRGFEEWDVFAGVFFSHGRVLAMAVGIERQRR